MFLENARRLANNIHYRAIAGDLAAAEAHLRFRQAREPALKTMSQARWSFLNLITTEPYEPTLGQIASASRTLLVHNRVREELHAFNSQVNTFFGTNKLVRDTLERWGYKN